MEYFDRVRSTNRQESPFVKAAKQCPVVAAFSCSSEGLQKMTAE